jgi:hypothetical protein
MPHLDPYRNPYIMTTATLTWTGTGVRESTACAVVRYHGATNTRGSRWIATIKRGADVTWRASLPYQDGPIAAAIAAAAKGGADWLPVDCHSIDADTYAVGF